MTARKAVDGGLSLVCLALLMIYGLLFPTHAYGRAVTLMAGGATFLAFWVFHSGSRRPINIVCALIFLSLGICAF